jgi:threonine/homoserine efflux transporter RhtA
VTFNRTWLAVGAVTVVVVVAVIILLVVNRPWESREYKACVRAAQSYLGADFDKSEIKSYCHQMYG